MSIKFLFQGVAAVRALVAAPLIHKSRLPNNKLDLGPSQRQF
jgi:hypothetical protein